MGALVETPAGEPAGSPQGRERKEAFSTLKEKLRVAERMVQYAEAQIVREQETARGAQSRVVELGREDLVGAAEAAIQRQLVMERSRDGYRVQLERIKGEIEALRPSPEEQRERQEAQRGFVEAERQRLRIVQAAAGLIEQLAPLVKEYAEMSEEMAELGAEFDLAFIAPEHDPVGFLSLLSRLPEKPVDGYQAWREWFIFGRRKESPYTVRTGPIELPETFARVGFFEAGETVWLSDQEAAGLLQERKIERQRMDADE